MDIRLAAILFLFVAPQGAFAATSNCFFVHAKFNYQTDSLKVVSSKDTLLREEVWEALSKPQNGVVLLGHVRKESDRSYVVETLVIDSGTEGTIVARPKLIVKDNLSANIGSDDDDKTTGISVKVQSRPCVTAK